MASIVILLSSFCIYSTANEKKYSDTQQIMLSQAKEIANNKDLLENKTVIGDVEGQPLYAEEIELFAKNLKAENISDPYKKALDHLKKIKKDAIFAEKNGIVVTDDEVKQYTDSQRAKFNDPAATGQDVIDFMRQYISTLGLTEDEYWNDYKPLENKRYLIHLKVEKYLKHNNLEPVNVDDIKYNITDQNYIDKINNEK